MTTATACDNDLDGLVDQVRRMVRQQVRRGEMSMAGLAKLADTSRGQLYAFLGKDAIRPTLHTVGNLAQALGYRLELVSADPPAVRPKRSAQQGRTVLVISDREILRLLKQERTIERLAKCLGAPRQVVVERLGRIGQGGKRASGSTPQPA